MSNIINGEYYQTTVDPTQGFQGITLAEGDSGLVYYHCVFDARPRRIPFAVAHPADKSVYKAVFRECVFYNFDKALLLNAPNPKLPVNGWTVDDCDIAYCNFGVWGNWVGYLRVTGGCVDANKVGFYLQNARGCKIDGPHFERNGIDVQWGIGSNNNAIIVPDALNGIKVKDAGRKNLVISPLVFNSFLG